MEHEPSVDTLHDRIETSLGEELNAQLDEVLAQWDEAALSERTAVRAYVSGLRNRMLRTLRDLDAEDELMRGLATQYIEAKCHWTTLNMQIQQQTARNDPPDESLLYRATCVSLIVQALEPFLTQERIDSFTSFLSEPLGS